MSETRFEPLRIDFELGGAMVVPDRHPGLFDALLLAVSGQHLALPFTPEALPLASLTHEAWPAGQFVWRASAISIIWTGPSTDRFLTRNAITTDAMDDRSSHGGTVTDSARGISKVGRKRVQLRCAASAVAWCVGDLTEIKRLVERVTALGAQRHQGMGAVRSVKVSSDHTANTMSWWRPLPAAHAADPFRESGRYLAPGRATPPYWHRDMSIEAWWPANDIKQTHSDE